MIINRVVVISNRHWIVWLLLAIPLAVMTMQYLDGDIYYGEYLHATGEFSARLLIVTMGVTPLCLAWPGKAWTLWLLRNRRYFGVATFVYAVPHLVAYMAKVGTLAGLLQEVVEPGMWTGWLALLLFLPPAITSNTTSVRRLGKRWAILHRLVYVAAIFTFLHWLLVAFNVIPALIHGAILLILEGYRIRKSIENRRA
ncbi:MAG: ferric reductase-like transmembrane domain-containing protein [Pseudomonadota bacterium]|nr:ferric reductase-like transmembrane domain-containing protein [Pseudomonadota bacterium]